MQSKIYVGNLPYSTKNDELREMFSQFGDVTSADVVEERETGRSKGFGFVEFATEAAAQAAIDAMNGKDFGGRNLVVNLARPREERGDSRPRQNGGGGGSFRQRSW